MEVEHVSKGAVCERGTEHWNVVLQDCRGGGGRDTSISSGGATRLALLETHLPGPVVHATLVVDFFTESCDDLARTPSLFQIVSLFLSHALQDRHDPIFKLAIVVIGNDQVSNAVHAPFPKRRAIKCKVAEVGVAEAFDEIFLDPARGGTDSGDELVLDEEQQNLAKP